MHRGGGEPGRPPRAARPAQRAGPLVDRRVHVGPCLRFHPGLPGRNPRAMIGERLRGNKAHPFILLGAVGLAYLNAFAGAFQFDDYNVIVEAQAVQSWASWWHDLSQSIRPLLKASYTLNWTSGAGLFGFHLVNLLVHAGNVLLVYTLSRRILANTEAVRADLVAGASLLTSLLFALHPVQTEAVTYVSGRSASLMTLFYLASLLTYVRGCEGQQSWRMASLSPFFFLCALAVKETAVTLPAALLLWELTVRTDRASWGTILRRQAAHWLLLIAALGLLLLHPRYEWLLGVSLGARSLGDNLLTQIHGIAYLLSQVLWPNQLNIDPDLPVITSWTSGLTAEAIGLALLAALGLVNLPRRPWLAFGILWFMLQLLPTNSVLPRLDVANDRQLYLAGWGLFLGGVVALVKLLARGLASVGEGYGSYFIRRVGLTAAALLLPLLLGWMTIERNADYRTEIALWEQTVSLSPNKPRAWNNLGYAYFLAGRQTEAREAYQTALRLDPRFALADNNLALLTLQ
ncbi:MAG: tetratricopeptide repeat protein [Nitrospirae bacterium]|nr:MAG: tetratricopeptide repeat protein [Nitrospirota bacterium]